MENNAILALRQANDTEPYMLSFYGPAYIAEKGDAYRISYQEDEHTMVQMKIDKNSCFLHRRGEYVTSVHIRLDGESYISITNEYGSFNIPIGNCSIICETDKWEIHYETQVEQSSIFHFKWEKKKEGVR